MYALQYESCQEISYAKPSQQRKYLKRQYLAKIYMTIAFFKFILTDESRVSLNGTDGQTEGQILFDADVAKRRQQAGGSVMICFGIDDQASTDNKMLKLTKN